MDKPVRRFILLTHKARSIPDFKLDDLPGSGGRMDIVARFITSALALSHGLRKDTEVYVILKNPYTRTILVDGFSVRYLNPDERTTAALIRNALTRYRRSRDDFAELSPGIKIAEIGLEEVLQKCMDGTIFYLREDGKPIEYALRGKKTPYTFILSDHMDPTSEEEKLIKKYANAVVSIGPSSLHSDHCAVIINNSLDKFTGFSWSGRWERNNNI